MTARRFVGFCSSVCLLLPLLAHPVRADGLIRDGLGAVSAGRGGTNIAHSDNGVILLDNPAGMVNVNGCGISDIGVDLLFCNTDYEELGGSVHDATRLFPLGHLSYIRKSADGEWAFGLGFFAPAGFGADYDLLAPPEIGGVQHYKSLGALGKILPGVACKLTDRTSIGATLGVGLSHAELEGPFFRQIAPLPGVATVFDLQSTGAAIAWSVGMQHQWTDHTTLGVTYTGQTKFNLSGPAAVDIYGMGPPLHSRFDTNVDLTWPRSLGIGLTHGHCRNRFSADIIWYNWSNAFKSLDMTLSNPSNLFIAGLLGSSINSQLPLNWRDSVSARLGYEFEITPCCLVRTGYVYHADPVPDATLTPYIPAVLEHAVSVGLRRSCTTFDLDLAYQFSFGPARHITTSGLVGGDFDNSRMEAQAHWLFVSLSKTF